MSGTKLVLETNNAVKKVRRAISMLSNAEKITVEEIVISAITALMYLPTLEQSYAYYCKTYSCYGSTDDTPTSDGLYLAESWRELYETVKRQYKYLNIWNENGYSSYFYVRLLNDDIIIFKPDF